MLVSRAWPLLAALLFAPALAWADCVDYAAEPARLVELEGAASKGALSEDQKTCLETGYTASKVQTTKSKISRVLLVNAYAYDTDVWVKLVQRHLEEVERSDPNIAYLYAFYLFNRDKPDYEGVIRWIDIALERRTEWTGDVLVTRVNSLHRVRSYAAYESWAAAMKGSAAASPETEELRTRAKTYSREWMDFARSSGRETKEAEELCISAASRAACGL